MENRKTTYTLETIENQIVKYKCVRYRYKIEKFSLLLLLYIFYKLFIVYLTYTRTQHTYKSITTGLSICVRCVYVNIF